jgi:CDP-2,3-bis-(O-geranylgeranyl)-sn-glycerol synthase
MPEFHLWVVSQVLALVAVANGVPVIAKWLLGGQFAWPIDGGYVLGDGQRLLGKSKTACGILLSVSCTALAGPFVGLDLMAGILVAAAAMVGDLLSSFTKRRLRLAPSSMAPGIDQVPESLLPFLAVYARLQLEPQDALVGVGLFWAGELLVSRLLFQLGIRDRPY